MRLFQSLNHCLSAPLSISSRATSAPIPQLDPVTMVTAPGLSLYLAGHLRNKSLLQPMMLLSLRKGVSYIQIPLTSESELIYTSKELLAIRARLCMEHNWNIFHWAFISDLFYPKQLVAYLKIWPIAKEENQKKAEYFMTEESENYCRHQLQCVSLPFTHTTENFRIPLAYWRTWPSILGSRGVVTQSAFVVKANIFNRFDFELSAGWVHFRTDCGCLYQMKLILTTIPHDTWCIWLHLSKHWANTVVCGSNALLQ